MKKIILACTVGIMTFAIAACSGDDKKEAFPGASETCNQFFTEIDSLVAKASENEQMKSQLEPAIKQLEGAKTELTKMPKEQQDTECKAGIEALTAMKKALNLPS